MNVTWGAPSIRTRRFEAALRVSTSFRGHLYQDEPPAGAGSGQHALWEQLHARWQTLQEAGDRSSDEYCERIANSLDIIDGAGETLFKGMAKELRTSASSKPLVQKISQQAFEDVEQCVQQWGGPKAKARLKALKALPVHCETHGEADTKLFFDRDNHKIVLRVGSHPLLLLQCMTLHFSFFHEYLSHLFPSWTADEEEISEGFLLALEFSWFEANNTPFEAELLGTAWAPFRSRNATTALSAALWLFHRCDASPHCAKALMLEWVASWSDNGGRLNQRLTSQLIGLSNKLISRFDNRHKEKLTKRLIDSNLCAGCKDRAWNLPQLSTRCASILESYRMPKAGLAP
jgi:hypothetical protein